MRALLEELNDKYKIIPVNIENNTLISIIDEVKVDFIRFKYPYKKPFLIDENIRMLQIDDIAPMKIDAVPGRGHKKDFFDLYYFLK